MTIWRIDARIVPKDNKIPAFDLHTFYIDCLACDVEKKAMQVAGEGRKNVRVNLTFGPIEKPRVSTAKTYTKEGIWLEGLACDGIYIYSEVI